MILTKDSIMRLVARGDFPKCPALLNELRAMKESCHQFGPAGVSRHLPGIWMYLDVSTDRQTLIQSIFGYLVRRSQAKAQARVVGMDIMVALTPQGYPSIREMMSRIEGAGWELDDFAQSSYETLPEAWAAGGGQGLALTIMDFLQSVEASNQAQRDTESFLRDAYNKYRMVRI